VQSGLLEELALVLLYVLPVYLQLRLFSQPQPSPLFIAADVQLGLLPEELETELETRQDLPFSKPHSPLTIALLEHVG